MKLALLLPPDIGLPSTTMLLQNNTGRRLLFFASSLPKSPSPPIRLQPGGFFEDEKIFEKHYPIVLAGLGKLWRDEAVAKGFVLGQADTPPVVVFVDGSPLSKKYLNPVIQALTKQGLTVYTQFTPEYRVEPIPLGMGAYFIQRFDLFKQPAKQALGGLMLTAGSRPWTVGGMRFLTSEGSMFCREETEALEKAIGEVEHRPALRQPYITPGTRVDFNFFRGFYFRFLSQLVSMDRIKNSRVFPFHDARRGASQKQFSFTLPSCMTYFRLNDYLETRHNPFTLHNWPSIDNRNLTELQAAISRRPEPLGVGLANNGDASKLRVVDEKGRVLCPDDVNLLLLYHMVENKKRSGVVVKTQDGCESLDELASHYGLPVWLANSHISSVLQQCQQFKLKPLLGIDSEGGVLFPEAPKTRCGLTSNLMILELVATCRRPLSEILEGVKARLLKRYGRKSYVFTSTAPEQVKSFAQKLATNGLKLGDLRLNRDENRDTYQWTTERGANSKEIILACEDGSRVFLKQDDMTDDKFKLTVDASILRTAKPKTDSIKLEGKLQNLTKAFEDTFSKRFPASISPLKEDNGA